MQVSAEDQPFRTSAKGHFRLRGEGSPPASQPLGLPTTRQRRRRGRGGPPRHGAGRRAGTALGGAQRRSRGRRRTVRRAPRPCRGRHGRGRRAHPGRPGGGQDTGHGHRLRVPLRATHGLVLAQAGGRRLHSVPMRRRRRGRPCRIWGRARCRPPGLWPCVFAATGIAAVGLMGIRLLLIRQSPGLSHPLLGPKV